MLRNILVIAAVVGLPASMARADLELGDPIDINGFFDDEAAWGSEFEGAHPFGEVSFYSDILFGTDIVVMSAGLPSPPEEMFIGIIGIIYGETYLLEFPHTERIEISGIKEPGGRNFINFVEVAGKLADFSTVTTDGFNITFEAESSAIALYGDNTVVIAWSQIPAPGTLALLGLAGLLGTGRRRRQ